MVFTLYMSNDQPQIAKMIASHHGRADWGAMIDLGERFRKLLLYSSSY